VLALHTRFAVWIYVHVERHRVAADRTVLDVVLVSSSGNIHWHNDLLTAGVADVGRFEMSVWLSAAAFSVFLGHGSQQCSP